MRTLQPNLLRSSLDANVARATLWTSWGPRIEDRREREEVREGGIRDCTLTLFGGLACSAAPQATSPGYSRKGDSLGATPYGTAGQPGSV